MILRDYGLFGCLGVILSLLGACMPGYKTQLSYEDILSHLTDLEQLPVIERGVYCKQFSSYDRRSQYDPKTDSYLNWDANHDRGNYIRIDEKTNEGVMADIKGPGCIYRIWSANPQGLIRFYLDGDRKPTYEWDFHKLFAGKVEPFAPPLVWKRKPNKSRGASNIHLPIPFAKSCKVTSVIINEDGTTSAPAMFYTISYRSFPWYWRVPSFKLPLTVTQQAALERTAQLWADSGTAGLEIDPEQDRVIKTSTSLPAGEPIVIAKMAGPAVIRQLRAKITSRNERWVGRKVLLRVYWDGQDTPAINCPLGDFFGEPSDAPYASYPMGITDKFNYCLFPMPFHQSAKIVLLNEGKEAVSVDTMIVYRQQQVPDNWGLFHAKWRGERSSRSFDYPLIEATGKGKLVGICLFPDNLHAGWWGEGDEKVYVDGEKFPSWFGTGSEDYFGDAWGMRFFEHPSQGQPRKGHARMQGCYRWHLSDSIPFYKSLRMTIENYTAKPGVWNRNDYSSVAYWYQLPGGDDFFEDAPVWDRIPREYVVRDAIDVEHYVHKNFLPPGMSIVDDQDLPQQLSLHRGIKLVGKIGSEFTMYIPVETDGEHRFRLGTARGVKASSYEILVDDQPIGKRVPFVKGLNPITIRFTSEPVEDNRCELIVDYVTVDQFHDLITDWLFVGPFPNPDRTGLETPYPPESELIVSKQYKGLNDQAIGWKTVGSADGIVRLNNLLPQRQLCIGYVCCTVYAPRSAKYDLRFGSDDAGKAWLNGKLVWDNTRRRPLVPDTDRSEVELQAGRNVLLVKLEQWVAGAGFAIRFDDPDGRLIYKLPKPSATPATD